MRIEDDDENLLGYDFPVTIYKQGGAEYKVHDAEALEYHILQGWSIEKPEEPEQVEPIVVVTSDNLDELREQIAELHKQVTQLRNDLPNPEMIKGQGQLIASINTRVVTLEKATKPVKGAVPPVPLTPPVV